MKPDNDSEVHTHILDPVTGKIYSDKSFTPRVIDVITPPFVTPMKCTVIESVEPVNYEESLDDHVPGDSTFNPDVRRYMTDEGIKASRDFHLGMEAVKDKCSHTSKHCEHELVSEEIKKAEEYVSSAIKLDESIVHPKHYSRHKVEPIDLIEALGYGYQFCIGNTLKYAARAEFKGEQESDLDKASWYLERANKHIRGKE